MGKFLATHKLPKMIQEEIENLDRSVTSKKICNPKLPNKGSFWIRWLHQWMPPKCKEKKYCSQTLLKTWREGKIA